MDFSTGMPFPVVDAMTAVFIGLIRIASELNSIVTRSCTGGCSAKSKGGVSYRMIMRNVEIMQLFSK